jgi:DNA-binding Lrp family transcriptional regulator
VRALIDPQLMAYELVMFAMIRLHSQAQPLLDEFERFIDDQAVVRESWLLSGDVDYILKFVARDLRAIGQLIAALARLPNVRGIRTSLALRNVKDNAIVPLESVSRLKPGGSENR